MRLAITAAFTSLVCATTMVFSIYVPHTRGFFNIGETMVYTTALLFGPLIGSFAGGVGSMLADLLLGYSHYAPATLIIKGLEGAIVGVLSRKRLKFRSKLQWKTFTFALGLVAGVLLSSIGSLYYSGSVELYLGIPPPQSPTSTLFIPPEFWYSLGGLVVLLVTLMGFVFEPEFGWLVLAIIVGGLEMVAGYFLYEQFFLGVAAIAEIPVNIGQMTVGLIVSIPIVRAVWHALPSFKIPE
ncbi:MAG: hypothetical protein AOA65_0814 [Candidatus Bathyarchaeota archaeon BA1]|nr:MAG: hypothetical protein AOA65_0814 [Candidatus Bathyarchaeota archaeon BA1]